MRNPALERFGTLVGSWDLTLTNAWFLESMEVEQHGEVVVRWLGEAFLELTADMEGERVWHFVFGHSDVNDRSIVLYHDPRPASRVFELIVEDGAWILHREDPDMHQRFVLRPVDDDLIEAHTDASDDEGRTWRKDFDLAFRRR
jgi:hypothetical protein